jgi:hypothetical protein
LKLHRELHGRLERIESLINKAADSSLVDTELQAHWARYLCVLAAGFLEKAPLETYAEFSRNSASPQVAGFARSILNRLTQNPNAQRFVDIATRFHAPWGSELKELFENGNGKNALDSIMNNRNRIAHGDDSGITLGRLREYLNECIPVIELIEDQCKGKPSRRGRK